MPAWRGRDVALRLTLPEFREYLGALKFNGSFRPAGMVIHNTAEPSGRRWRDYPGARWLKNLKDYYNNPPNSWSAGPHAFVAIEADGSLAIWVMTDFNIRGTHSPSWNGTRWGIEMVSNFDIEDDDSGDGLRVKQAAAELFAICHQRMGWEPSAETIKAHYEDKASNHACPGKDFEKAEFVQMVLERMGEGGDPGPDKSHADPAADAPPAPPPRLGVISGVRAGDHLNVRAASSASSRVVGQLNNGDEVHIAGGEKNGETVWLRLSAPEGYVNGRYVTDKVGAVVPPDAPQPPAPVSSPGAAPPDPYSIVHDNVMMTEFGGPSDPNDSAYTGKRLDWREVFVALPGPVPPGLRHVMVSYRGRNVRAAVEDKGPWNMKPGDPDYLFGTARPMAEGQFQRRERAQDGRVPINAAGIDASPALMDALAVPGRRDTRMVGRWSEVDHKVQDGVSWRFVRA